MERPTSIVSNKLLMRGQHLSTMAFMSTAGLLDCATVTGGVNGDIFYEFVHNKLLYHLNRTQLAIYCDHGQCLNSFSGRNCRNDPASWTFSNVSLRWIWKLLCKLLFVM